jgi:hypothetical protein
MLARFRRPTRIASRVIQFYGPDGHSTQKKTPLHLNTCLVNPCFLDPDRKVYVPSTILLLSVRGIFHFNP